MRMVNDMDMYNASVYTKAVRPMWMKDERIDYCDTLSNEHRSGSFFHNLFHKRTK